MDSIGHIHIICISSNFWWFTLTLIWLHARKNRLIDNTVSHIEIQNVLLESILLPSVFVISILISIVDLQIAYYFWMVIIPAKIIIRKRYP
jgi:hypothetical protein